jgi:hypothetical protein
VSYFTRRLAPGEIIVATGRFHWLQHFYAWVLLVLLGIVLVGIAIWVREMFRSLLDRDLTGAVDQLGRES